MRSKDVLALNALRKAQEFAYKLLELPLLFKISQVLGRTTVAAYSRLIVENVKTQRHDWLLDIGCGVGSFKENFECQYIGIDNNPRYIENANKRYGNSFKVMDAFYLEFPDNSFDHAVSIATFHHLSDSQVLATVAEALRICRPQGALHIIDAVYPEDRFSPVAWLLFYCDRGNHQRHRKTLQSLLETRFRIDASDYVSNFPHNVCYFKIVKPAPTA
jgi:ubiquinone/menaquinone biosynthesis C-methylase UbiE